jgi:hypothetical protein
MRDAEHGRLSVDQALIPNKAQMNLAWPTESLLLNHLTLPFLTISIASIPCKVFQAVQNEP